MSKRANAVLLAMLVLAGCSSIPGAADQAPAPLPGKEDCLFIRTVFDWRALDDERILIRDGGASDAYLVILATGSFNLTTATAIAFADGNGDGRLCSYGGDAVLIPGSLRERRSILAVRRIPAAEADALLGRKGPSAARSAATENR